VKKGLCVKLVIYKDSATDVASNGVFHGQHIRIRMHIVEHVRSFQFSRVERKTYCSLAIAISRFVSCSS